MIVSSPKTAFVLTDLEFKDKEKTVTYFGANIKEVITYKTQKAAREEYVKALQEWRSDMPIKYI